MLKNIDDVAEMFDVHKRTIQRWIDEQSLPCIKVEKTLRFDEEEIKEWWKTRREQAK